MQGRMRDQTAIDAEASQWLVRRGERVRLAEDDEAFFAWLEADPRHGETYDALARTWEDIGELKGLAAEKRSPLPAWSLWAGVPAALAAAATAFFFLFPDFFNPPDYATRVAEIRSVRLEDGSVVTLGAKSEIDVEFGEHERRVRLTSGEAFFEVARNSNRPFFVEAGDAVVRVVGTKFDVHRGHARVRVAVVEGVVEVREAQALAPARNALRVLRAGERIDVAERPILASAPALAPIARADMGQAGAWRQGRLAYDDALLADLVADVNRYYAPGVRLISADAGRLRVTASFRVNEIPAFLDALDDALPVAVSREPTGAFRINAQPDAP